MKFKIFSNLKTFLLIPILFLAGCASAPTFTQEQQIKLDFAEQMYKDYVENCPNGCVMVPNEIMQQILNKLEQRGISI